MVTLSLFSDNPSAIPLVGYKSTDEMKYINDSAIGPGLNRCFMSVGFRSIEIIRPFRFPVAEID